MKRKCNTCGEVKELDEFTKCAKCNHGRTHRCRKCSAKKNTKTRPVKFGKWEDHHTLGAFCAKTNTVNYAIKHSEVLRRSGSERDVFFMGIDAANTMSFEDLAYDITLVRNADQKAFDSFIASRAGAEVLAQILVAIDGAKDWETEKMKSCAWSNAYYTDEVYGKEHNPDDFCHSFVGDGYHVCLGKEAWA